MSNMALRMELDRVQRINDQLRAELATIVNGVSGANRELESFNTKIRNTMDNCNSTMYSSHKRVVDAIALQGEIEVLYVRFKQMELANKKIRECNNKKYYDFANYRTVRKIVQGMLDNLDVQMVSDKTIAKSVEKQHLQVPDYWLTCVLISIMAWRNDDRELADMAMARALKLDKKNSAIFYMLINLRMGRDNAALKWFYTYQECEFKGSDQRTFLLLFSLVSKTIEDNLEDDTKNEIKSFIHKVIEMNMKASGYSEEEIVDRIKGYYDRMRPDDRLQYALLRRCCTEFSEMSETMMMAKGNLKILEFILDTMNVPAEQRNKFLKDYVDELIAEPNQTEKDVYDEIAYNECVIRNEGIVETAKEQFEKEQERKAKDLNLIAEMIDWIYENRSEEVNGQIKLSMFILTKSLQEKAAEAYVEDYRKRRRDDYNVTVGDYSTTLNIRNGGDERGKITNFFTAKRDEELSSIKAWPVYLGFAAAGAIGIGAIAGGLFGLLALSGAGILYGLYKLRSNKNTIQEVTRKYSEEIEATYDTINKALEELRQYNGDLDEYDSYYERIKEAFARL